MLWEWVGYAPQKLDKTFGGAYFYERKKKNEQKILARIQNICYSITTYKPFCL